MSDRGEFLRRACPVCGRLPSGPKEMVTHPPAESIPYATLIEHWNGLFKNRVFFSYTRCEGCGVLFAPTFFDECQLQSLYRQMPPNMDVIPKEALSKTQFGYFKKLRKHSPLEGQYIEVGPDVGLFTRYCARMGKFSRYWLFEPNQAVRPALHQAVAGKPSTIIHDMFNIAAAPDKSVGAAVLIHVLDHLLNPAEVLTAIRSKLTADGVVLIVTHNESSVLRRLFGPRWPPFCLQHPELYNPKSMRALLKTTGFEVLEIARTINYFPVQFLARSLLWALGLRVETPPRMAGVTLGLKLGNMIAIAKPSSGT